MGERYGLAVTRSWWWLVSSLAMGLFIGLGTLGLVQVLLRPLALIFLGFTLAATLAPLVNWLARWLPRTAAVIVVYITLALVLAGVAWLVVPALIGQAQELIDRLPSMTSQVENWIERWQRMADGSLGGSLDSTLTDILSRVGAFAAGLPAAIAGLLAAVVLVMFVSIYVLMLLPRMDRFVFSLFPDADSKRIGAVINEMSSAMGGYLRGSVLNGLAVGTATYFGLLIIGVDYPLVLGILAALLELIPMLGPIISAAIITFVALLESLTTGLITLAFMVLLQQVENNLLVPNIMRSQTSMSPLLTLVALFVGGAVGGLLGALLAIPLAGALRVLVVEVLAPAVRRQTGAPRQEEEAGDNGE